MSIRASTATIGLHSRRSPSGDVSVRRVRQPKRNAMRRLKVLTAYSMMRRGVPTMMATGMLLAHADPPAVAT